MRTLEELARELLPGSPWEGLSRLNKEGWSHWELDKGHDWGAGCPHEVGVGVSWRGPLRSELLKADSDFPKGAIANS